MKLKLSVLFLIGIICLLAVSYDFWPQQPPQQPVALPATPMQLATAPDVTFITLDHNTYRLKNLPEPGILLHFWASWCGPCQTEFPALLQRVQEANGRLALLAISIDDQPATMTKFINQRHIAALPHVYWVWDHDKLISLKQFNTTMVPETILIDRQRQMVNKFAAAVDWSDPRIGAAIHAIYK